MHVSTHVAAAKGLIMLTPIAYPQAAVAAKGLKLMMVIAPSISSPLSASLVQFTSNTPPTL